MVDSFSSGGIVVLAIGLAVLYRRRTQPIAITLLRDLRRDRHRRSPLIKSRAGGSMSREKEDPDRRRRRRRARRDRVRQLQVQAGDGVAVNIEAVQKRNLEAIVSASGKIQPKRSVNISADTMGRVTDLAVDEGRARAARGSSCCEIDPRNLTTRVDSGRRRSRRRARRCEQLRARRSRARKTSLKQAQDNYNRQQQLWKAGPDDRARRSSAPRTRCKMQQADLRVAGAADQDAAAAHARRSRRRVENAQATT